MLRKSSETGGPVSNVYCLGLNRAGMSDDSRLFVAKTIEDITFAFVSWFHETIIWLGSPFLSVRFEPVGPIGHSIDCDKFIRLKYRDSPDFRPFHPRGHVRKGLISEVAYAIDTRKKDLKTGKCVPHSLESCSELRLSVHAERGIMAAPEGHHDDACWP